MGARYGAHAATQTGTGTSVTTLAPTGANVGRLLVLCVHSTTVAVPDTPSGWNYVGQVTGWFGDVRAWTWWRVGTGTAADAPTLTLAASEAWESCIVRVLGANLTNPISAFYNTSTINGPDPITTSDVTIPFNGSLAIAFGGQQSSATFAMGSPAAGYTVREGSSALQSGFFVATAPVDEGTAGGGVWDWPGVTRPVIGYIVIAPYGSDHSKSFPNIGVEYAPDVGAVNLELG